MRGMWFDFAHQPGDEGDGGDKERIFSMPNPPCPKSSYNG
jgi:hypothetical protein